MKKLLLSAIVAFSASHMVASEKVFEGFEGWDFVMTDWLPDGWTEQYSDETIFLLNDGVFTWHVGTQTGYLPHPPQGDCYAMIYYAYDYDENGDKFDMCQDEWMISPSYAVGENSELSFYVGYSPLYLFDLNNENVNWSKMEFVNRKPSTTLKIYVRTNGGDWVLLKDLYDQWKETSLSDLFNTYSNVEFRKCTFDLSEYKGIDVQVAFQFVGIYGNTMEIDSFQITDATTSVDGTYIDQRLRPVAYAKDASIVVDPRGAKCVDIYSVDSGLIATQRLDGQNVVRIDDLPTGLYLLRFNDGTVIKILK